MTSIGEFAEKYMSEYRAADPVSRNKKRESALFEFYKWKLIKALVEELEYKGAD